MATLRFSVSEPGRLDRALAVRDEIGSRALAERLVAEGAVLVDGRVRPKSHRLEGGEEVAVELPAAAEPLRAEEMDLSVAWEDEHLLVVDKPAGVVVHPVGGEGPRGNTGVTLVHGLLALDAAGGEEDRPGIVHRLDRDTSGLLVVARSEDAHARLQELIRRREVEPSAPPPVLVAGSGTGAGSVAKRFARARAPTRDPAGAPTRGRSARP